VSDVAEAASPQATGSDYRMAALPAGIATAAATTGSPPRALAHGPGGTARGPGGAICRSDSHQVKGAVPASLARRVMSLAYEALLLSAVLLAGTLPFVLLFRDADPIAARPLLQLYLVAIAGLYFGWEWLLGGAVRPRM